MRHFNTALKTPLLWSFCLFSISMRRGRAENVCMGIVWPSMVVALESAIL